VTAAHSGSCHSSALPQGSSSSSRSKTRATHSSPSPVRKIDSKWRSYRVIAAVCSPPRPADSAKTARLLPLYARLPKTSTW
jgi:hypothetical protein